MNDDITTVFHGFLNLKHLDKLKLVGMMNEYFDHLDRRESIRAENAAAVALVEHDPQTGPCPCCGR